MSGYKFIAIYKILYEFRKGNIHGFSPIFHQKFAIKPENLNLILSFSGLFVIFVL